jgi:hypothetical protein
MNMFQMSSRTWRSFAGFVILLASAAVLLGCEGDNLFRNPVEPGTGTPGGGSGGSGTVQDTIAPSVDILQPEIDAVVAAGDSLGVRIALADAGGIARIEVSAFSDAGGTQTARFVPVSITAGAGQDTVRSDTLTVFLSPTGPQENGPVTVLVRVTDFGGNTSSDAVVIATAVIRGRTIPLEFPRDSILDVVSDGRRIYLSNYSRNRIEVLPIGGNTVSNFRVGSKPWGLAVSTGGDSLFVANSGGTNISVVDLNAAQLREVRRISTPNIHLYDVTFNTKTGEPSQVVEFDYSDRPQYIAQTATGQLLYSTKPTGTAPDGTIRRRTADGQVEFFVGYAERTVLDRLVVVNALNAALVLGDTAQLTVLPRGFDSPITGSVFEVCSALSTVSDTRCEFFLDIAEVGLSDTTFVAVSGDHGTIAFGEGVRSPGRVIVFQEEFDGFLVQSSDVGDLLGNAAERVIGLALNADGSLGAARGNEVYFFTPDVRLQGVTQVGPPSGGLAMHPEHTRRADNRFAFVSGKAENGSPFVDVVDTFNFFRVQRIFLREAITGPLIAVATEDGTSDAVITLYGITARGILEIGLTPADLRR